MTTPHIDSADRIALLERRQLAVRGTVQGVGFRPFVFRLATELGLVGSVENDSEGVVIDIQGPPGSIALFARKLSCEAPPLARITQIEGRAFPTREAVGFVIRSSNLGGTSAPVIPPDIAVCDDCLAEMRDPEDRRYRYPFINCTNCGPRYTITSRVPYDRRFTSMNVFPMCEQCEQEYNDPRNRRFHAQPNACPVCGPHLWLHDGKRVIHVPDVIAAAHEAISRGQIVALRSLGGFHLACDATNESAVKELRRRKSRPHKPFAVMVADLIAAHRYCYVSDEEAAILTGPIRPIMLLRKKLDSSMASEIAPDTDHLGLMLPSAPLHHLMFHGSTDALVMTSGNLTDEPITVGNNEALARLSFLADLFVLHNREIVQRVDDSIVQRLDKRVRILRRARGYVPAPIRLPAQLSAPVLACGAELKGTVALGVGDQAVISQHLGDLDNPLSMDNFEHTIRHLEQLLDRRPEILAHDFHPDYLSTRWARSQKDVRCVPVQHHHAHLVSVMTESGITEPCLGIILDGTGYGADGTVWGGELLYGDAQSFERLAWLDPVQMPGSEVAIREPWRMALSYLIHAYGDTVVDTRAVRGWEVSHQQVETVRKQIQSGINTPRTSSCGRLFDGVASMLGLCYQTTYEAQAAIRLEKLAASTGPLTRGDCGTEGATIPGSLDASPLIRDIWERICVGQPPVLIARRFHVALAELLIAAAKTARSKIGGTRIALSGGVFQNRLLLEYMTDRLRTLDFEVISHLQVPTNDGGLALGQLMIADALNRNSQMGQ